MISIFNDIYLLSQYSWFHKYLHVFLCSIFPSSEEWDQSINLLLTVHRMRDVCVCESYLIITGCWSQNSISQTYTLRWICLFICLFILQSITEFCGQNLSLLKKACIHGMQIQATVRRTFWASVSCYSSQEKHFHYLPLFGQDINRYLNICG